MAGRRFVRDPGLELALFASAGIRDALDDRTQAAARTAEERAPDDPRTGAPDLHSDVYAEVELTARGYVGRVGDTNFKTMWYEEGTVRQAPRPYLRPAVEQEIGPIEDTSRDTEAQ